ncbi:MULTISPECIES: L,D-transpeptidase [unclassified Nocardia]|uniref:L,D-transpeptidase n=1 Tax=unclassified Nocardia TaxID=2637762 RepID=UPI001CE3C203|nr:MULTISPECIES: L,D-transpeptidase [unclassified Nocardia]
MGRHRKKSESAINRWGARAAVVAGVTAAGFGTEVSAQAQPLWSAGPLWPAGPLWSAGPVVPAGPEIPDLPSVPALPGLPALLPPAPVTAPCSAHARACFRLSTNEGWLMDNGKVTYGPTPVSFGRPGYETPPGVFHVNFKEIYHWSTLHNAEMRYAVFFNGDIATHIGPIEEPSHGCVRMTPDGARAFFEYLEPGDVVEVVE